MPEIDRITVAVDADLSPLKRKLAEVERFTAGLSRRIQAAMDRSAGARDAFVLKDQLSRDGSSRSAFVRPVSSQQRPTDNLRFGDVDGGPVLRQLADQGLRSDIEAMCRCLESTMSSIAQDSGKLTRVFDGMTTAGLAMALVPSPLSIPAAIAGFGVGVNLRGSNQPSQSFESLVSIPTPDNVDEMIAYFEREIEKAKKLRDDTRALEEGLALQRFLKRRDAIQAELERVFSQANRPLPGRDDIPTLFDLSGLVDEIERWAATQERIAEAIGPTLDAFCRIEEKTRSIRENLEGLPVFDGSDQLGGGAGGDTLGGDADGDILLGGGSDDVLLGDAAGDALAGIERASAVVEEGLGRLRPELEGLGATGEAVFDILAGGLRGATFEGQGLLATLEGIAGRVRDLALDEVLFPFLKKELGGIFAAGEEGPGAAGDKVFGPAAEGLGTLAESAWGGADALRETGLATAGVTSASGAAAGALVNELTAGALQTALATGTQSAASQSLTAALAAVTASANAAAVALQGLTVSAGGGGGAGGILGSLLGTATGGGFDPGVGPGGLGFLHFGGPRQFGGPVSAGTLFETHGLGRREFFIPNVDGAILPGADIPDLDMARLRVPDVPNTSGGGGGAPAIQQHVTINNTFQGRFTRREAQDLLRVAERMDEEAINGLRRNVNRGGPDAQLFGRRAKR